MIKTKLLLIGVLFFVFNLSFGQSPSFQTFTNPVIPGDHPDPTLTKIGDYFFSSGSSFNPTPKIYRSTNLVHWEVIAQPVTPEWDMYGRSPGGGVWGGHTVYYNDNYWHYFGRGGGSMYFVTAKNPAGAWSSPTEMNLPPGINNLGVDNSVFIDSQTNKWYLLTKAGHENNHMVELGNDGQPTGEVLDLTWLNPNDKNNPYGWAEGPVMWEYNGYYYYSFAEHLVGEQYVMRSDTLTDKPDDWEISNTNIYYGSRGNFDRPNHISPVVELSDGTMWAIGHSYHVGDWYAQGRQGLLHRVEYEDDWPVIAFPTNSGEEAPNLPSGGVPWMVPKSDMFNQARLSPEWSYLGQTQLSTVSLSERTGWLYMEPRDNNFNTLIKNDGEHQYSLITRVDSEPESPSDEAGLWIFNGPENRFVKVYSSANDDGEKILAFSFEENYFEVDNTIGSDVWLRLVRNGHNMNAYYSENGDEWIAIGNTIDATLIGQQDNTADFNAFTGNQQGLYVQGKAAYFNLYIYRDAYSDIGAQYPANQYGVQRNNTYLGGINNDDWALYAGVEFGSIRATASYRKVPVEISLQASSANSGGVVEVWLDSVETGQKIGEVEIQSTESWSDYVEFTSSIQEVSGRHDVYLRFRGNGDNLFRLKSFRFNTTSQATSTEHSDIPTTFKLEQNYPNPFNPTTVINFELPDISQVSLTVYDVMGREVQSIINNQQMAAGRHQVTFDGSKLSSGVYLYRIQSGDHIQTRKLLLVK